MSIPRKKASTQEDWLTALSRIRERPDVRRAQLLVEQAAERVSDRIKRSERPTLSWSGGKDSLALQPVAEAAGIRESVIVLASEELEYPSFEQYLRKNSPTGIHVERREGLNYGWLMERPHLLFPQTAVDASRWYQLVQHTGQRQYAKREGVDLLLLGRRRADGNHVSRESGGYEYRDKGGFARYSPIADWTHEDALNVIASYGIPLPEIYHYPRGFIVGTGPWPARTGTGSLEEGWREVMQADPSVVEEAAIRNLAGARQALKLYTP